MHVEKHPAEVAADILQEVRGGSGLGAAETRELCRRYTQYLKPADPAFMRKLGGELVCHDDLRYIAYDLLMRHPAARDALTEEDVVALGQGISSWWTVDAFARILSGPLWLRGQLSDGLIHRWARSQDRWWRRAALVSTVALNVRSHGGKGDVPRTLGVCRLLADDRDDMVVKGLSWALRALAVHDPKAVEGFLREHEVVLAARVKREVRNKIATGLKTPKRGSGR